MIKFLSILLIACLSSNALKIYIDGESHCGKSPCDGSKTTPFPSLLRALLAVNELVSSYSLSSLNSTFTHKKVAYLSLDLRDPKISFNLEPDQNYTLSSQELFELTNSTDPIVLFNSSLFELKSFEIGFKPHKCEQGFQRWGRKGRQNRRVHRKCEESGHSDTNQSDFVRG